MILIDTVNIEPFLKAIKKFELFRQNLTTEQEQAGAIQTFEYCFELSWKIMQRLLGVRGKVANSPKEAFRMAGLEGFIKDPELWFDFLKKRNLIEHSYEESEAQKIISVFSGFSQELHDFLKNIINNFEESDLPYKVDVVDWNKCSDDFRELIKKDLVQLHLRCH